MPYPSSTLHPSTTLYPGTTSNLGSVPVITAQPIVLRILDATGADDPVLTDRVIGELSNYGLAESATPLVPGDTSAATSQMTVSGVALDLWKLSTGKDVLLTTAQTGSAQGTITQVSLDVASNILTVTADSLLNRLNKDLTALPQHVDGPAIDGADLTRILAYYAGQVGIDSSQVTVDPRISWMCPVLPGFIGNGWDHLKQLCAAYGWQLASTGTSIILTPPGVIELELDTPVTVTHSVDAGTRAKNVQIQSYGSRWVEGILHKATEVYSVGAGEVQTNTVQINATPATLTDPVCVQGMDLTAITGQYVVTGSDGYIVDPAFWADNGGSITVAQSTSAADELVITITGATVTSRAPYRISEGAADRPALWISGTGVTLDKSTVTIPTTVTEGGVPDTEQIDNLFIRSVARAYDRGELTAGFYGAPALSLRITGTPDLRLVTREWTQYAAYPNLLREPQAALGRVTGIADGWGHYAGDPLPVVPGSGFTFTATPATAGLVLLRSVPLSDMGLAEGWRYTEDQQWFIPATQGLTYTGSFTLTRNSSTEVLIPVIDWFDKTGAHLGQTVGGTPTYTTGVSTTISVTGNAPSPGGSDPVYAVLGLTNAGTAYVDYLVEWAQIAQGTLGVPATPAVIGSATLDTWFGSIAGAVMQWDGAWYRVVEASFQPQLTDLILVPYNTMSDFDTAWAGKTFADFDTAVGALTLDQLASDPLLTAI